MGAGLSSFVIPGLAQREPGIHARDCGFGFRACAFSASRNDGGEELT
jgi:hypothetical protein